MLFQLSRLYSTLLLHNKLFASWCSVTIYPILLSLCTCIAIFFNVAIANENMPDILTFMFWYGAFLIAGMVFWTLFEIVGVITSAQVLLQRLEVTDDLRLQGLSKLDKKYISCKVRSMRPIPYPAWNFREVSLSVLQGCWITTMNQLLILGWDYAVGRVNTRHQLFPIECIVVNCFNPTNGFIYEVTLLSYASML